MFTLRQTSLMVLLCAAVLSTHAAPLRIAHRGGTDDAPENTLVAVRTALDNGADAVWVTVQLSRDGVPVLYRPATLDALTDMSGPVSAYSAEQLAKADAGAKAGAKDGGAAPWRGRGIGIPTLAEVLSAFPETRFFIDVKSPDAPPAAMAGALAAVLRDTGAGARTRVYSTEQRNLDALAPQIARFESRDFTRTVLAQSAMAHRCVLSAAPPAPGSPEVAAPTGSPAGERWYGFEMKRDVEVVEKYTLGEARSRVQLVWDQEAVDCFRAGGPARLVLFDVKDESDYRAAKALGADAVMINSPARFRDIPR